MKFIRSFVLKLLDRGGTYLKTDLTYLIKGGFWLTLGQGVASISAFALSIVFANFLSQETYGTYKFILSLAAILALPTLPGIATALQRAVARGDDGAAFAALKVRLLGGTVATFGTLVVSGWYFLNGNEYLGFALMIVAALMPIMEAVNIHDSVLQGKGKFGTSTLYFSISSTIATVSLVTAIFLSGGELYILLATYFGTWAITRFIAWEFTKQFLTKHTEEQATETATYGFRLTLISIASAIANNIDKILLFHFLGPIQLAVYTFATAVPEQIKTAARSIIPLALSRFSRRSPEEIRSSIHQKALYTGMATIPIVALYILCAPLIFSLLFPAYTAATFPSQVFALSLLFTPAFIYNAALQSQRSEKLIAISDIGLGVLQVIMLILLIPLFGIWGAIFSRLIARYTGTAVLAIFMQFLKHEK